MHRGVLSERSLFDVFSPQTGRPVQTRLLVPRRRNGGGCGGGDDHGEIFLRFPPPSGQRSVPVQRLDHVVRADQLFDRRDFRLFGRRVQIGLFRLGPRRTVPARFEMERRRHAADGEGQFRRSVCPTPSRRSGRPTVAAAVAVYRGHGVTGQRRRSTAAGFGRAERAQRTFARIITAGREARIARRGRRHVQTAVAASAAVRPGGFVNVQVQRDRFPSLSFFFGASPSAAAAGVHNDR